MRTQLRGRTLSKRVLCRRSIQHLFQKLQGLLWMAVVSSSPPLYSRAFPEQASVRKHPSSFCKPPADAHTNRKWLPQHGRPRSCGTTVYTHSMTDWDIRVHNVTGASRFLPNKPNGGKCRVLLKKNSDKIFIGGRGKGGVLFGNQGVTQGFRTQPGGPRTQHFFLSLGCWFP